MNDKEMFWSLISPHLEDRPNASGRVYWGLDRAMSGDSDGVNYDLERFVNRNHLFVMPQNMRWQDNLITHSLSDFGFIPIKQYPHKMIILTYGMGERAELYFHLQNHIIKVRLQRLVSSKNKYAIGRFQSMEISSYVNPAYRISEKVKYAILPSGHEFLNWIGNPFRGDK